MSITNGYNKDRIVTALTRLGWRQPTAKGYDIVDTDNQTSASGRYYNGFHKAVTIENVYDCQPDDNITDEEFNTYLTQMRSEVILSMLTSVFNNPQFIGSGMVFNKYQHSAYQSVNNTGKFVGLVFNLCDDGGFALTINNAILLFDKAATFKLYLYNEFIGKVAEYDVTVEPNKQKILAIGQDVYHQSETVQGGVWFLGYYQDDLGDAKAIDYSPDKECFKSFGCCSFETAVTDYNAKTIDVVNYAESYNTYGLNAEVSEYKDLTNKIVVNAHLFDELQGLMMAANVIELIRNSNRSNATKRISEENILQWYTDLKGMLTANNQWIPGIESRITAQIKQIQKAFIDKPSATVR